MAFLINKNVKQIIHTLKVITIGLREDERGFGRIGEDSGGFGRIGEDWGGELGDKGMLEH